MPIIFTLQTIFIFFLIKFHSFIHSYINSTTHIPTRNFHKLNILYHDLLISTTTSIVNNNYFDILITTSLS